MDKKQLIDFANAIKELCVENGRLEHKAENSRRKSVAGKRG